VIIPSGYGHAVIPHAHNAVPHVAVVTFGFANIAAEDDPAVVAEGIWDAWSPNMVPLVDSEVTVGPVQVRINVAGTEFAGEGTSSSIGGSTDVRPPPAVAVLYKKRSGLVGRQHRGRFYLPFSIAEAGVSEGGVISPATLTSFQTAATELLADLVVEGYPMRILHNAVGGPTVVNALQVDSLVATQRRRQPR
jgi:hypothetical protein